MPHGLKTFSIAFATAIAVALVVLYVADFLAAGPSTVAAAVTPAGARLTLQTVASYGHSPHPDWVSYLVQDDGGKWQHTTIYKVPAHSLVQITIYQYDTATGLRNPFFGQARGTVGGTMTVDGKVTNAISPDDTSHTFTIPEMGVSVPLKGIADDAKNQCSAAPCTLGQAHTTVTFTIRTGAPGKIRWQCFVPCALKFIFGNGGPMQSIGWMDGYLQVV